ncbi:MAG: sugar-transfer associated ATP-grasp domain-containing protein [Bacillota bacterium]
MPSGPDFKSKYRQLAEMIWLGLRYRFSPIEYRTYRFFFQNMKFPVMLTYLSNYELANKIRTKLYDNSVLPVLNNKLFFNLYYRAFGLSLPDFYAYYHPEHGFTADKELLRNEDDLRAWLAHKRLKQFFIKPCGGKKGTGVIAISDVQSSENSNHLLTDTRGKTWSVEELCRQLHQGHGQSAFPGYVIEEKIEQDPFLSQINPSSVNTCRILTLALPDNTVAVLCAAFRFGRAGSPVDSWSQGGIAFSVDVSTGMLKKGAFHPDWGSTDLVTNHPDSNIKLTGTIVPHWEEIKDLVRKAASVTPGIKSIGWDVTISRKRPVLIEGNSYWSPLIFQGLDGGFLNNQFRNYFKQYKFNIR